MEPDSLTYAASGVDPEVAERAVRGFAGAVEATHDERVLGGIGGFGGMFAAQFPDIESPVLVSSIDGVGTKTVVAAMAGDFSQIGYDIVNHCVNDILCQGARPLFFLDYFGCSRLDPVVIDQVVNSAAAACSESGCALLGGETAEMPGVYMDGEIDVVGAIVGVVDRSKRLPREKPRPGAKLVGIASDGLHTNGYTLARQALFSVAGRSISDEVEGLDGTLGQALLKPHRSYLRSVLPLLSEPGVLGAAHITGGGIAGNLVRVIPSSLQAVVETSAWNPPAIFQQIQRDGTIETAEMFRAFNMGIGMILVVEQEVTSAVVSALQESGEHAAEIGQVHSGPHDVQLV
ncbi:MAG: phosphoribosylformylglycinamidine cyclo-ligase [Fimbriimonadaceae bacterium]